MIITAVEFKNTNANYFVVNTDTASMILQSTYALDLVNLIDVLQV